MVYITPDLTTVFVINYKCGFSTFEYLVRKGMVHRTDFHSGEAVDLQGKKQNFDKSKVALYGTIRNPYKRLLSFYNDKFINCFLPGSLEAGKQTSHQTMFEYVDEAKIRALRFGFSDLIKAMEEGYDDVHLFPQTDIIHHFGLRGSSILNIDKPGTSARLDQIFGFKLPVRNRSIKHGSYVPYAKLDDITASDRSYIEQKYREDLDFYKSYE